MKSGMAYNEDVYEKLVANFELLCNIVRQNTGDNQLKVDLTKIEDMIKKRIPDTLKKNAPEDFYELYTDFKSEYEKFRDFILYDKLIAQYKEPDEHSLKSLNALCVRLVFCLYAEDAGIFGSQHMMFHDYLRDIPVNGFRKALIELFKILDTKIENRDKYLTEENPRLAAFPYVNGGLFADETIEIPMFTEEIKSILLNKASADFDWSDISPTIFGAVFESTLNPETRRSGGMHYTSIENIHKVIDPLSMDELREELNEIKQITVERTRKAKLNAFQEKIAGLKFLDPACGSGNFLTETYLSLRRLENEILNELQGGQIVWGEALDPIQVSKLIGKP